MFTIKQLSTDITDRITIIQAVADIEAIVQAQEPWTYQTVSDLLEQDSVKLLIVANAVGDIVGYCLYQVVFEQAEILRIGTNPQYQRQGIASQLFVALNKELRNHKAESLILEVRADNAPAIALYGQQGFTLIHRRKGYYQQPHQAAVDALIMQLIYIN